MQNFDAQYWDNRYQNNTAKWDLGEISLPIKTYIEQIDNKNLKILIPGCGNAYEAEFLINQGFNNITLIDLSSVVVKKIQEKFAYNQAIKVIQGDFFEHNAQYDLIIEQTFFCALNPILRQKYFLKMKDLLVNRGKLVGVLFNRNFEKEGPPFGGTIEEYKELISPYFQIKTLQPCYNSHPARIEAFINLIK